jgi:hypothetical protein
LPGWIVTNTKDIVASKKVTAKPQRSIGGYTSERSSGGKNCSASCPGSRDCIFLMYCAGEIPTDAEGRSLGGTIAKSGCGSSADEVKSLSPHYRFVIVLHSPGGVDETGLPQCPSERKAGKLVREFQRDTFSSPVYARKLRNCGEFRRFLSKCSLDSPQSRLNGGARSLALTVLRRNSLLTGKNTGNLQILAP